MKSFSFVAAILMLFAQSGMAQFSQSVTQTSASGTTKFVVKQTTNTSGTSASATTTTSSVSPNSGTLQCTCTQSITNTLYSDGFAFLAGGSADGACGTTISDSFSFNLDPNAEYNWYTEGYSELRCTGMPMRQTYLMPGLYKGLRLAHTHAKWTGTPGFNCSMVAGKLMCSYSVNNYCSNTNSPTLNMNGQAVANIWAPSSPAYDVHGPCQWYSGAWHCLPAGNLALKDPTSPAQMGTCTVLPPLN